MVVPMTKHLFVAVTCLCAILLTGGWQGKTQTTNSGKAVLEAYVSAWNRHDFAALDKLVTPDAVHEDIAWPSRDEGAAQIKKFMREMIEIEPDFDWRLTTIVDGGSVLAAEWTWTATFTGDSPVGHVVNRRVSGRGVSVAVIENGRIKRFSDYYDFASFFRNPLADSPRTNK